MRIRNNRKVLRLDQHILADYVTICNRKSLYKKAKCTTVSCGICKIFTDYYSKLEPKHNDNSDSELKHNSYKFAFNNLVI